MTSFTDLKKKLDAVLTEGEVIQGPWKKQQPAAVSKTDEPSAPVSKLPNRPGQVVSKMIQKYRLQPFPPKGNEIAAWTGRVGNEMQVHVASHGGGWFSVEAAFGDIWHSPPTKDYKNPSAAYSDRGQVFYASSRFETPKDVEKRVKTGAGTGIKGHKKLGMKWHVSFYKGKRSWGTATERREVKVDDIIAYALKLRDDLLKNIRGEDHRDVDYDKNERDYFEKRGYVKGWPIGPKKSKPDNWTFDDEGNLISIRD